jgi:hypothetical protein
MATPESNDAVSACSHGPAFEQKRGEFKPQAPFLVPAAPPMTDE